MKFDNAVDVLLSEGARWKSSGAAETSGSSLSVERVRRLMNREKKKNDKFKSKSGRGNSKSRGVECRRCGEKEHIQRDCNQKNDGESKSKEKDFVYVME